MPTDPLPDPDTLLARVDDDIARGEAFRARNRLKTWQTQFPDEPRYAIRLGELMAGIEEWPSAGEAFVRGGSMEEGHQDLMTRFLASHDEENWFRIEVRRSLARAATGEPLPPSILKAVEARGLNLQDEMQRAADDLARMEEARSASKSPNLGMWVFLAFFVLVFGLGLVSLIRIVGGWVTG